MGAYIYSYGFTLTSNVPTAMNIVKVETYDNGVLSTTFTNTTLTAAGIPTVINANSSWGMEINFRIGISATNSYMIVYVDHNGQIIPCKYPISLIFLFQRGIFKEQ